MNNSRSKPSAPSARLHLGARLLTKTFRGNFGRLPSRLCSPEITSVELGDISLQLLRWLPESTPATHNAPLLLVHGLNNNAWSWKRVAGQLCDKRSVTAVSLRGHGTSTSVTTGYSLHHTTYDLTSLLDKLSIPKAHVAGHSWGGKVATHFTAMNPDRVASLTLADPVMPGGLNNAIRLLPSFVDSTMKAERGPFPDEASWLEAGRSLIYMIHWDDTDRQLWTDAFRKTPEGTYHHCLPDSGFEEIFQKTFPEDLTPLLPRIKCPVLLMRPTLTLSFLPGEHKVLGSLGGSLKEVRIWGDHTFIHTNPIDAAAHMKKFLEAVETCAA